MTSTEVRRTDRGYEIVVDDVVAGYTRVREGDGALEMPHTVVEDAFEGQGLAGRLVREALDDIRSRGLLVHPTCPYVSSWIQKHPEYRDLVDDPERFGL